MSRVRSIAVANIIKIKPNRWRKRYDLWATPVVGRFASVIIIEKLMKPIITRCWIVEHQQWYCQFFAHYVVVLHQLMIDSHRYVDDAWSLPTVSLISPIVSSRLWHNVKDRKRMREVWSFNAQWTQWHNNVINHKKKKLPLFDMNV